MHMAEPLPSHTTGLWSDLPAPWQQSLHTLGRNNLFQLQRGSSETQTGLPAMGAVLPMLHLPSRDRVCRTHQWVKW